jgi:hypothetical protein
LQAGATDEEIHRFLAAHAAPAAASILPPAAADASAGKPPAPLTEDEKARTAAWSAKTHPIKELIQGGTFGLARHVLPDNFGAELDAGRAYDPQFAQAYNDMGSTFLAPALTKGAIAGLRALPKAGRAVMDAAKSAAENVPGDVMYHGVATVSPRAYHIGRVLGGISDAIKKARGGVNMVGDAAEAVAPAAAEAAPEAAAAAQDALKIKALIQMGRTPEEAAQFLAQSKAAEAARAAAKAAAPRPIPQVSRTPIELPDAVPASADPHQEIIDAMKARMAPPAPPPAAPEPMDIQFPGEPLPPGVPPAGGSPITGPLAPQTLARIQRKVSAAKAAKLAARRKQAVDFMQTLTDGVDETP